MKTIDNILDSKKRKIMIEKASNEIVEEVRHPFVALWFSYQGLVSAIKNERAFRHELLLGIVHFAALFYFSMTLELRVILSLAWCILLATELLNTAVEAIVDKVSPEWHELAKRAKDCGSAAVYLMLLGIALSWLLIIIYGGK